MTNKVEIGNVLVPGVVADPRCLNFGLVPACTGASLLVADPSCKHHLDRVKSGFDSEPWLKNIASLANSSRIEWRTHFWLYLKQCT
jgi:hypothetical protein